VPRQPSAADRRARGG